MKANGYEVGKSLVDDEKIDYCKEMMQKAKDLKARYWYMIQCLKTVGTYLLTASPLSSSISAIP